MPKLDEMAQLSRPFQIALVAVCLLAGIWLFALQGHSSSPSSAPASTPATPAPASTPAAQGASSSTGAAEAKSAAAPTPVYHGAAPGVEGLTRAINKAHGAVATSQQNARQLEQKSAQASDEAASAPAAASASAPASTSTAPGAASVTAKQQTGGVRTPVRQAGVERALSKGKIAVILFWNPKGADDVAVARELRLLEAVHHAIGPIAHVPQVRRALRRSGLELQKGFAAFRATAGEVSSFGSITRGVQVSGTPTLLVVNKQGHTTVLTGLQDAFSIEQAIEEARSS
jgi:hypothetical protein